MLFMQFIRGLWDTKVFFKVLRCHYLFLIKTTVSPSTVQDRTIYNVLTVALLEALDHHSLSQQRCIVSSTLGMWIKLVVIFRGGNLPLILCLRKRQGSSIMHNKPTSQSWHQRYKFLQFIQILAFCCSTVYI